MCPRGRWLAPHENTLPGLFVLRVSRIVDLLGIFSLQLCLSACCVLFVTGVVFRLSLRNGFYLLGAVLGFSSFFSLLLRNSNNSLIFGVRSRIYGLVGFMLLSSWYLSSVCFPKLTLPTTLRVHKCVVGVIQSRLGVDHLSGGWLALSYICGVVY